MAADLDDSDVWDTEKRIDRLEDALKEAANHLEDSGLRDYFLRIVDERWGSGAL